jgi:hypothetical protein
VTERCFACDRVIKDTGDSARSHLVECIDEQTAFIGPECFRKVKRAGVDGWQPPKGGPRLFCLGLKPAQLCANQESRQ